jgi:hypothetical protein
MRKDRLYLFGIGALILSGCSVFEGNTTLDSEPETDRVQVAETTAYTAPTLPPVNTPTLAPTTTRIPPPTPSPFTVVIVETPTPESGPSTSIPTSDFNFGGWERYETTYAGIAFDTPINMVTHDYGRLIRIGDPNFSDEGIPLFVEFQVDHANSGYLPDGINPSDPRSIMDGILREFDKTYTEVTMIRNVTNMNVHGYPGSNTAVRTQLTDGSGTDELIWYLAAVVHEETIVRIYAQSPAITGGVYLSFAQHMMETIEFLPEP